MTPIAQRKLTSLPILHEDDDEGDMGESNLHTLSTVILHVCIAGHLRSEPQYGAFANMDLYYHPDEPTAYVSPDLMVVRTPVPLPFTVASYRIGTDGPPPRLTVEVLSQRSIQQRDLTDKPIVYAGIGVAEYILVDPSGRMLPQKLLLKQLRKDGTWKDKQDEDGGVTSKLGFRIAIEADGMVAVYDTDTGRRYVRPHEAEEAVRRQTEVEEENRRLIAELEKLKRARGRK